MTVKMLLLQPMSETDTVPPWAFVDVDLDNLLDEIYSLLDVRGIDCFVVTLDRTDFCLVVDDEGLLKEDSTPCVPAWYWYSYFNEKAPIVGRVLVGKRGYVDGEPDLVGLDAYDMDLLSRELAAVKRMTSEPTRQPKDPS